ncbi:hypothetical protein [Amycolatopsis cihanbeyliensis]|uniref:Uncharacterized protein n=1 Tax=Amycolatopsis cihanbeyliensis TaxID=1128664 RepID=A0A542DJW1_AMYCI|nr:hypothetical protein [Amycolatopsis cihanbeyliensis]TQJ03383.1 hypothetical protein FB471_3139 [Amycolatopsis cihanbeyliensis]
MVDSTSTAQVTDRVHDIAVPAATRAFSTLSRIDYENALLAEVASAGERPAEQWARAIIEGAPAEMREMLAQGWAELGMELGGDADRSVLGWSLRQAEPDLAVLGATSGLGFRVEMLVERRPHAVLFGSFVQFDNEEARALWATKEHQHAPGMRALLEGAVTRG